MILLSIAIALASHSPRTKAVDHFQVPMSSDAFSPVVEVSRNGRVLRFLIDSGSDESVVASDLVPEVAPGTLADLNLGPLTIHARPVARAKWQGFDSDHLDGLLGVPDLKNYVIGFDFAAGKADFWARDLNKGEAKSWLNANDRNFSRVDLTETDDGLLDVPCSVGSRNFRAIVDTGSNLNQIPTGFSVPEEWQNLSHTKVSTNYNSEDIAIYLAPKISVDGNNFQWKMVGVDPADDPEGDPNEGLVAPSCFWGPKFILDFRAQQLDARADPTNEQDLRLALSDMLRKPVELKHGKLTLQKGVEVLAIGGVSVESLVGLLDEPDQLKSQLADLFYKSEHNCEVDLLINGRETRANIPIAIPLE